MTYFNMFYILLVNAKRKHINTRLFHLNTLYSYVSTGQIRKKCTKFKLTQTQTVTYTQTQVLHTSNLWEVNKLSHES